jgi:hypothetical protein
MEHDHNAQMKRKLSRPRMRRFFANIRVLQLAAYGTQPGPTYFGDFLLGSLRQADSGSIGCGQQSRRIARLF